MTRERKRLATYEERLAIYSRDGGICQHCHAPVSIHAFEVAHRIAQGKANRKKWGDAIIDHPLNKAITHRDACNSGMNIGHNPMACAVLVAKIERTTKEGAL